MSQRVFTVAEPALPARAVRRSALWSLLPLVALVLIDLVVSLAVFMAAYKLHNDSPMFIWKYKRSALPLGIWPTFEPYFMLMLFVLFVKLYALRRYGLSKQRVEISCQGILT